MFFDLPAVLRILRLYRGCPGGVMVKAIDCGIVSTPVELLRSLSINTLGKGMNSLILPAIGLNSTTTVLLGE